MISSRTSKQVDPFYLTPEWETLRRQVLKRDDYTCKHCGIKCLGRKRNKPSPHIDHIEPRREAPAKAMLLSNLRTLCHSCHSKTTANARHGKDRPTIGLDGYPVPGGGVVT